MEDRAIRYNRNIVATKFVQQDLAAFEKYASNHQPAVLTQRGHIQWQGSLEQFMLLQDIEDGSHVTKTQIELESNHAIQPIYKNKLHL